MVTEDFVGLILSLLYTSAEPEASIVVRQSYIILKMIGQVWYETSLEENLEERSNEEEGAKLLKVN